MDCPAGAVFITTVLFLFFKAAWIRSSCFGARVLKETPNRSNCLLFGIESWALMWNEKASGCLDAWQLNGRPAAARPHGRYISSLLLMKQIWTVHRLRTSVKFRIEFTIPSGAYLDGCQMWQIAGVWPPERESQTDICSQRPDGRRYAEEMHLVIIVMGWRQCPYGWVTSLQMWLQLLIPFSLCDIMNSNILLVQVYALALIWELMRKEHHGNIIWS